MNRRYLSLPSLTALFFLLTICHAAQGAKPVKVTSADPAEAPQATPELTVVINGSGFDSTVSSVKFLLPCSADICTETGGVEVSDYVVNNSKIITATLTITDTAIVAYRDIEVRMSRGRGGKGTTLFRVQEKASGNSSTISCNEAYFPSHPGNPCTDMNGESCDLRLGNPERIKLMTEDCKTTETIVLPNTGSLHSDANIESPADYKTLTAVIDSATNSFTGQSVIANAGHRATVRALNIEIAPGVATGCGTGLESAVRFVLDGYEITDLPVPEEGQLFF